MSNHSVSSDEPPESVDDIDPASLAACTHARIEARSKSRSGVYSVDSGG